jgi:hypothetical protein
MPTRGLITVHSARITRITVRRKRRSLRKRPTLKRRLRERRRRPLKERRLKVRRAKEKKVSFHLFSLFTQSLIICASHLICRVLSMISINDQAVS